MAFWAIPLLEGFTLCGCHFLFCQIHFQAVFNLLNSVFFGGGAVQICSQTIDQHFPDLGILLYGLIQSLT